MKTTMSRKTMKHSDPATPPNVNGIVFGFALVVLVFGALSLMI